METIKTYFKRKQSTKQALFWVTLFVFCFCNFLVWNSYFCFDFFFAFDIAQKTHTTVGELESLFRHLLFYLQGWQSTLPLAPFSASLAAKQHFVEVRFWFILNNGVGLLLSLPTYWSLFRLKYQWYWIKQWISLLQKEFLLLFGLMILAFGPLFTIFHLLLFSNQKWLFHLPEDSIIYLLPESLFQFYFCYWGILLLTISIGLKIYIKRKEKNSDRSQRSAR